MSTQRAFVIQFLPRPDDAFCGRVEHVGSGEAAHFASADDLLAFLHRLNGGSGARAAREAGSVVAVAAAGAARRGTDVERPPPRPKGRRGGDSA